MTTPLRGDVPAPAPKLGAALPQRALTGDTKLTALGFLERVLARAEGVTQEGGTLPGLGVALAAAADRILHTRLNASAGTTAPAVDVLPMGHPAGFVSTYFHPEQAASSYTVVMNGGMIGLGQHDYSGGREYPLMPFSDGNSAGLAEAIRRLVDTDRDGVISPFLRSPRFPTDYKSDPFGDLKTEGRDTYVVAYRGHSMGNWPLTPGEEAVVHLDQLLPANRDPDSVRAAMQIVLRRTGGIDLRSTQLLAEGFSRAAPSILELAAAITALKRGADPTVVLRNAWSAWGLGDAFDAEAARAARPGEPIPPARGNEPQDYASLWKRT